MAGGISLQGSRDVARALDRLRKAQMPEATAEALNKVGFEILDAEEREVKRAFGFAGPSTKKFLSRGFRFDPARASQRVPNIRVRPKQGRSGDDRQRILSQHVFGGTVDPEEQLRVETRQGTKIAIPKNVGGRLPSVKRGRAGKVRTTPAKALEKRRTFITQSGSAILRRRGKRRSLTTVLFVLVDRAKVEPKIDFFGVIRKTARREFPRKVTAALRKARQGRLTAR